MSRKPYTHQQAANWYLQNRYFKFYMLREFTALTTVLAALNLFYGVAALASDLSLWLGWIEFQKNPLILLINLIIIAGSLYHGQTWFVAMPKAMPIQRGTKFVPAELIIKGAWATVAVIFIFLIILTIIFS